MPFKELTVDNWTDEINNGLLYRQRYGLEKDWAEIEAIYYNVHDSQINAGPNIIFSTGDALLSELNVPNPYLTLKARTPDFIAGSRLVEQVDNTLIDDMQMDHEVGRALHAGYLYGVGFLKIGFDSEFGYDPSEDAGGKKNPQGFTLTQRDQKTGDLIEFRDVKPGMPWIKSVLPHDVVVPWGCIDVEDSPWVAHRIIRHIEDVKSDPKYSNKKGLQPVMSMEDYVRSYQTVLKPYRMGGTRSHQGNGSGGEAVYCELWEIHDKRTGKIYVISTGYDEFLRNEANYLQLQGLPFIGFSFTPRSKTLWTTSYAMYLKRHQHELSDISVQQTKLRRMMNLKFGYDEDMISESELSKLTSVQAGAGIKITTKGKPIRDAIEMFSVPPNYELGNQAQQVMQNLKQTVGFNSNSFGEYQSGRKTAREVSAVEQGSGLRMSRLQGIVRDIYEKTFRKINPMLVAFWHTPRIASVVGQNGTPTWMSFTGMHLGGEFDYSCGFSDSTPETKESRKQEALQIWQTMSQSPYVNPVGLAQYLANAFNDVDFSSVFQPGMLQGVPSANVQAVMQAQQQEQQAQAQGGNVQGQPGGSPNGAGSQQGPPGGSMGQGQSNGNVQRPPQSVSAVNAAQRARR